MTIRTTETSVVFLNSFTLSGVDGPLPAGTYRLDIDEEQLADLSFLAFRRTATTLHVPRLEAPQGFSQRVPVDCAELDAVLDRDRHGQTS